MAVSPIILPLYQANGRKLVGHIHDQPKTITIQPAQTLPLSESQNNLCALLKR